MSAPATNTPQDQDEAMPTFRLETEQDLTDNLDPPFVITV